MENKLPPGWQTITSAPSNRFVLVLCEAGTVNLKHVVLTARFTAGYHDRWDTEDNDALSDYGYKPIAWRYLSDLGL